MLDLAPSYCGLVFTHCYLAAIDRRAAREILLFLRRISTHLSTRTSSRMVCAIMYELYNNAYPNATALKRRSDMDCTSQ